MQPRIILILTAIFICQVSQATTLAAKNRVQESQKKKRKKKKARPFRWVNPLKQTLPGVQHKTFRSASMKVDVGYCIYLPPSYMRMRLRFPVVYYLHGGRPGSEIKSVGLARKIDKAVRQGIAKPKIYVFVNGGPVSHYNLPDRRHAMGEDVFIQEFIPHIDKTYRTIADRKARGIEGFSQGGRGTARIMFKHPELFSSAAPGGGGYATEKRISEDNGRENDNLVFAPGYNTWDLARRYAERKSRPKLEILVHVGTKGFNYQNNLEYMEFLRSLKIPFDALLVPDVPHSAKLIYDKRGNVIMQFHDKYLTPATED